LAVQQSCHYVNVLRILNTGTFKRQLIFVVL